MSNKYNCCFCEKVHQLEALKEVVIALLNKWDKALADEELRSTPLWEDMRRLRDALPVTKGDI